MTPDPLLSAPPAVQLHVAAALLALLLGPVALLRRSRDRWHRAAGVGFALALATAALLSFAIREARDGGLSVIHALSVLTLLGLAQGLAALRRGDGAAHGRAMRALYAQALVGAGIFTLLPGRRMSLSLFPDAPLAGFALVAAAGLALAVWVLRPAAFPSFLRR